MKVGKVVREESIRKEEGFTLLELLISMGLLLLIVTIAMGALRLTGRSMATGERHTENKERLRAALALMDAQLESQLPLTYTESGEKKYYFRGERDSLRVVSNYSMWNGSRCYVVATYRIAGDGRGGQNLYVSEQLFGVMPPRETLLLRSARDITFSYTGSDEGASSQESWKDDQALPQRITLEFTLDGVKKERLFEVRARGERQQVPAVPYTEGM
ncbi:MAG: prepilin-type N-terminal cleavage/methylation domain-containing protein [Smithellaceae bacterium]|nr:prepilin-type N-terminal cleavage/methylation domain-containing protein [Smithellaceae bacterium]